MRPTIPAAGPAWDLSTEYADTDDPAPDADLEDLAPLLDEFDRRNRILATCIPMLSDPSTATTAVERDAAIAAARETHVLRENAARLLGSAAVYDNCRLAALELRGRLEPPQVRFSDAPEPLSQFLDLATQPWIDAYLDDDRTRASAFAVAHSRRPGHAILELEQERPRRRSKTWRSTYCVPDVAARGVAGSAAYCGAAMRGGALALLLLFAVAASAQSPTTDGDVDAETPAGPIDAAAPGSPEGIASGGWDDPTLGPADAAVTLFEFTDYSCPYSRDNAADVLAFAEEHPDLRVVFKLLPLQGDASVTAALAAVAAARQPGWPEFHAALMGSRPGADIDDAIREAATAAGMDLARLERDMERDEAAAVVERTRELAEHVGVRSTPRYLAGDMDLGNWIPRQVLGALLSRAVGGGVEAQLELGDALYDHLGLFSRPFASQAIDLYTEVIRLDPENTAAYIKRSQALTYIQDFDRAIADCGEAIRLDPDNSEKLLMEIDGLRETGTVETYTDLIRRDPSNAAAYFLRGRLRFSDRYSSLGTVALAQINEDTDNLVLAEAMADFGEVIRLVPNNVVAHFWRGVIRERQGDYDGSAHDFTDMIRHRPGNAWGYYHRGVVRRKKDDLVGAIEDFDEGVRLGGPSNQGLYYNPNPSDDGDESWGRRWIHYGRGVARQEQDDQDGAIEDFTEAIRLNPNFPGAYRSRGVSWQAKGDQQRKVEDFASDHYWRGVSWTWRNDHHRAIEEFDAAIRLDPHNEAAYGDRAWSRLQTGNHHGAIKDYGEAIRLNPAKPFWYIGRGDLREGTGDRDGALADYDEAIRLDPSNAAVYHSRGVLRAGAGDHDGALADYDEAIRLDPGAQEAYGSWYFDRGVSRYETGDYDGAIADFGEVIRIRSWGDATAYYARGLSRAEASDHDGALADFDEAIRLDPDYVAAYYNRGVLRHEAGDHDGALADFGEVVRLDPDNALAYNNRGVSRRATGDHDGALDDFGEAIRLDPDNAPAYFNRGVSRQKAGDHDGAMADFGEAIRLDPDNATAYYNRGVLRQKAGDHDGAMADFGEAVRLDPDDAAAYNNRGVSRRATGDHDGALDDFGEAIRLDPDNAPAYFNRGVSRQKAGDHDGAMADFGEVVRLDPDDADAYYNRGVSRRATGDHDGALDDFGEAVRLDPDNAPAYFNRGVLRQKAGDHDGAMADFGEVVRLDPDNALAYNNRGVSRRATGDHDGALDDFGEAIRLDPDNAPAYFNRGVSRQKAGDHDGAMADFGEVVRLDPDDADAYYNRGVSRRATGDHDGALDDFGEAIRLDPDYVAAYYNRGESRVETGDHDGAVEDYAVAVRLDPDDAWPHNSLAWILAVGPSNVRDGERAVRLSRKALALEDDAFIRDTLAAALVATGELDAAVDEYEAAIRQDPALVDDYGDILISEGYALTASAGYDAAMRAALHTYVRSECQLLSAEDRRLYRRGASCADEGE